MPVIPTVRVLKQTTADLMLAWARMWKEDLGWNYKVLAYH